VRITPETFVKVTIIAIVGTALVRMIAGKIGIPGLAGLAG
jgi:hypothetical protein